MKKFLINAVLGAAVLGWLAFSEESIGHKAGVIALAVPGILYARAKAKRKQADKDAAAFNSFKR